MDNPTKLALFVESLGHDADVDFAQQVLEAHDWDLDAALLTVTDGGVGGAGPPAAAHGYPDVDEDGYRAPMRTGYHDQLVGPSPEALIDLAFNGAAAARASDSGVARGHHGRHRSAEVQRALEASAAEHARLADHDEQAMIAQAIEASYASHMQADMQRYSASNVQSDRAEQDEFNRALEESYKESALDAEFREQMARAEQMSLRESSGPPMLSAAAVPSPAGGAPRRRPSKGNDAVLAPRPLPVTGAPRPAAMTRPVARGLAGVSAEVPFPRGRVPMHNAGGGAPAVAGRGGPVTPTSAAAGPRASASSQPQPVYASPRAPAGPGQAAPAVGVPRSGSPLAAAGGQVASLCRVGSSSSSSVNGLQPAPLRAPPEAAARPPRRVAMPAPQAPMATAPAPAALARGAPLAESPMAAAPAPAASARGATFSVPTPSMPAAASLPYSGATRQGLEEARRRQEEEAERRRTEQNSQRLQGEAELRRREAEAQRRRQEEEEVRRARAAEEDRRRQEAEEIERRRRAAAEAERQQRQAEEAELRRLRQEAEEKARRQAAAVAAAQEEQRRRDEAENAVKQAAEAKRRADREAEELRREREEAEARQREAERSASSEDRGSGDFAQALVALRKRYKDSDAAGLLTCLQTLRSYINNLARNPAEPKFQRINRDNNAFRTRVAPYEGAVAVLEACGFEADEASIAVSAEFVRTKGSRLWDALAKVDVMIEHLKSV